MRGKYTHIKSNIYSNKHIITALISVKLMIFVGVGGGGSTNSAVSAPSEILIGLRIALLGLLFIAQEISFSEFKHSLFLKLQGQSTKDR